MLPATYSLATSVHIHVMMEVPEVFLLERETIVRFCSFIAGNIPTGTLFMKPIIW